jgi:hypothetical protein
MKQLTPRLQRPTQRVRCNLGGPLNGSDASYLRLVTCKESSS